VGIGSRRGEKLPWLDHHIQAQNRAWPGTPAEAIRATGTGPLSESQPPARVEQIREQARDFRWCQVCERSSIMTHQTETAARMIRPAGPGSERRHQAPPAGCSRLRRRRDGQHRRPIWAPGSVRPQAAHVVLGQWHEGPPYSADTHARTAMAGAQAGPGCRPSSRTANAAGHRPRQLGPPAV